MQSIPVPSHFKLERVIHFINKINALPPQSHYCFDFSGLSWVDPFGMLFIAQALKDLNTRNPSCSITCENLNSENATFYAGHMGFFRACGFSLGNNPGFRSPSNTYIPITYAQVKQLKSREEIESISKELAKQLTQQSAGLLVDALGYSFREMIRNVVEHSNSEVFAYCAQYWPTSAMVEVALLDTGMGLLQTLSQNPHLHLQSDKDAVKHALMPGISGKTYEGVKIRHEDVWQNSGYGLYMNYRLCNEGGSFFICSGATGLYRTSGNDNLYYETLFQGTALRLRLSTRNLRDVKSMLDQFSYEGEMIARQFGKGAVLNASTMSKMLKDNFKFDYQIEVGDTVAHRQFGEGEVRSKEITTQGEMLWVQFKGGRRKKVLSKDVTLVNEDTLTYVDEDFELYDESDDIEVIKIDDDYLEDLSNDSFF